jgi:hypothetical protein
MGCRDLRDQRTDERRMKAARTAWLPAVPFQPIFSRHLGRSWAGSGFRPVLGGGSARAPYDLASLEYTFLEGSRTAETAYHFAFHVAPRWVYQSVASTPPAAAATGEVTSAARQPNVRATNLDAAPTKNPASSPDDRLTRLSEVVSVFHSLSPRNVRPEALAPSHAFHPVVLAWQNPASAPGSRDLPTTSLGGAVYRHSLHNQSGITATTLDNNLHASWQTGFVAQSLAHHLSKAASAFTKTPHNISWSSLSNAPLWLEAAHRHDMSALNMARAPQQAHFLSRNIREHSSVLDAGYQADQTVGNAASFSLHASRGGSRLTFGVIAPAAVQSFAFLAANGLTNVATESAFDAAVHNPSVGMPGLTFRVLTPASARYLAVNSLTNVGVENSLAARNPLGDGPSMLIAAPEAQAFPSISRVQSVRPALAEPLSMVVRLPAPVAAGAPTVQTRFDQTLPAMPTSAPTPPVGLPADMLQRLIDQVVRSLDARALAERERFGRF